MPTESKQTNLERTVLAAEHRERRAIDLDPYSPQLARDWWLGVVDSSDFAGLIALSAAHGSLAGLLLAAEGVGL